MKKTLALFLTILFALGCLAGGALAASEESPEAENLDPAAVEAQAFALAMAADDARDNGRMDTLAADAAGWYAAWLWRTQEIDLVTEDRIRDFLLSLRCEDEELYPAEWEDLGTVRRLRDEDGLVLLDYAYHKERLENVLGVTAEFRLEPFTPEAVNFTVIRHLAGDETVERVYTVAFEPNPDPDSRFSYGLISITAPAPGPAMDPELTFDWDMLTACNKYSVLLDLYPGIRIQHSFQEPDMADWVLRRGGEILSCTVIGGKIVSGSVRGCWFTRDEVTGRVLVFSVGDDLADGTNAGLLYRLGPVEKMTLEAMDDERIHAVCPTAQNILERVSVDRGTLALREYTLELESGELLSRESFTYDEEVPDASFMDGWTGELRTVTVHWEEFTDDGPVTRTQTVQLPADWEYLPGDAQWGNFIAWMDEGYTRPYAYPGDGVDYELYLTTARG